MRVVVAHSQAQTRLRFSRVLSELGHEVIEAVDAGEALARCRQTAPDVALVDASEGARLLAGLVRDPDAYRTAVVLVEAAGPDVPAVQAALRAGAHDVLVEPVSDGELVARVLAAERTKELQDELVGQSRRLEALVREDPLTGVANRRAILTQLAGLVSAARRHGRPLSVAVLDLDHFKRINDEHGHLVGDHALVAFADACRSAIRATDLAGRYGGEEFVLLLVGAGPERAVQVTEEISAALEQHAGVSGLDSLTASFGITQVDRSVGLEQNIDRADRALYRAKADGRNRAVQYRPEAA